MIETLEFLDTILIYIILSQYTMKQYQYVFSQFNMKNHHLVPVGLSYLSPLLILKFH
jgi:hypothetical protein